MIQFSKAANVYFLVITFMQIIPAITISGGKPAMAFPLFSVVFVSMVKDAFEDYKRHINDKKENEINKTTQYDPETGQFEQTQWQRVRVGKIVKINEDEYIPADMLILNSSGPKGTCYVETKNLDGETNLKIK